METPTQKSVKKHDNTCLHTPENEHTFDEVEQKILEWWMKNAKNPPRSLKFIRKISCHDNNVDILIYELSGGCSFSIFEQETNLELDYNRFFSSKWEFCIGKISSHIQILEIVSVRPLNVITKYDECLKDFS